MAQGDEKITKFVKAINDYAEQQRREILRDVEDFKADTLLRTEQDVLSDCYRLTQKEKEDLQAEMKVEFTKKDAQARHELILHRQQIMDRVFAEAAERIGAYTQGPAYDDMLTKSIQTMKPHLPPTGSVFELRRADADKLPALQALCGDGNRVDLSDDILLGGLRATNAAAGLSVDDTLDTRLAMQKDWFVSHSELRLQQEDAQ